MKPQSAGEAVREVIAECREWWEHPSLDEVSDIAYGIGRMIAGIFGRRYVHVPGDRRHIEKIEKRMTEYGCIRSKRHLVEGRCPSGG